MDRNSKNRIAYDIYVILGVVILLCLIMRLWPVVLFMVFGAVFGAIVMVLKMIYDSHKKPEIILAPPMLPPPPEPKTENDMRKLAFEILVRRITEELISEYPNARWVWETPYAEKQLFAGSELFILLNRAGGYRRAKVVVSNLQFVKLEYVTAEGAGDKKETGSCEPEEAPDEAANDAPSGTVNYELLALQWVEEHFSYLNNQCNEAIARDEDVFDIPASILPVKDSWDAVCVEIERNGFTVDDIYEDGISVQTPQSEQDREEIDYEC